MADNFTANPGVGGVTFAGDEIAGVVFLEGKITLGADGVDGGDVSTANPLPVRSDASQLEDAVHASGDRGIFVLAVRQEADTAAAPDGDYTALHVNSRGRLKVSAEPADIATVTGNITASAQNVNIETARLSNLSISMIATSLVGHNISFEASNNSTNGTDGTWYAVQVVRSNANTVETTSGVLAATPAYMWQVNVSDYGWFRVRATAHTSGTAAYILSPSVFASEPIPASQVSGTQPVSGTVTATVTGATIAAGTAAIGDVGQQYRASATGAGTPTNLNSPATPAVQTVKGSAGRLIGLYLVNSNAATRYLKVFNATAPTLGTTAATLDIAIPLSSNPVYVAFEGGIGFATAITVAITGGRGTTDNTAITANDVTGFSVHA